MADNTPEPKERTTYQLQPISGTKTGLVTQKKPKILLKRIIIGFASLLVLIVALLGVWYNIQLSPLNADDESKHIVKITVGSTPSDIGKHLQDSGIIRNAFAFEVYTRIMGKHGQLQAGTYRLSASETVQQVVRHLTSGDVDTFNITFLPGGTVADARKALINAGFDEQEVDDALGKAYEHRLFEDKPGASDLEGYIWGETYNFNSGVTAEEVLIHTFNNYYKNIKSIGLIDKAKAYGLNMYEAITLASIIQKESTGKDQAQISQVFHLRLKIDMPLGSDPTYQYIADKLGVPRAVDLDNPYNTRIYKGLPPGPIASPGNPALTAAVNPADGDYLYFLSGDDDVTYFSRTFAEHEKNRVTHCQKKCQIL